MNSKELSVPRAISAFKIFRPPFESGDGPGNDDECDRDMIETNPRVKNAQL